MRLIDKLHLDHPYAGARMLRELLRLRGIKVGRRRVGRLIRKMGIEGLCRKLNTSYQHPENPVYPYWLRHLKVERPNEAWAMDITYIPMARGFIYLAAAIDWYSRKVLSWRVLITTDVQFCLDAVIDAIYTYGTRALQHRPGQSVHVFGSYRPAQAAPYPYQHGRQGSLARQCLRRAAVAHRQARRSLP